MRDVTDNFSCGDNPLLGLARVFGLPSLVTTIKVAVLLIVLVVALAVLFRLTVMYVDSRDDRRLQIIDDEVERRQRHIDVLQNQEAQM